MRYFDSNIIAGNARVLRGINRTLILNIIRERQPISRIDIARTTGLNKSTVSSIIYELMGEDLIFEQVAKNMNIGRNPLNLSLKLGKYYVGAINIDSALTHLALADIDGCIKVVSNLKTNKKNPEKLVEHCADELKKLCGRTGIRRIESLGVSIAGIVDPQNLNVNFAPNLEWEDINIGNLFKRNMPDLKTIAVGNDAQSSALAELWFGDHKTDLTNFVFISIGQGIGAGIIIEKSLLYGEYHAAGEFGHSVIIENGEACVCGNKGCWESYASERAIVKNYNRNNNPGKERFNAQEVFTLAKEKDEAALKIIRQTGYYLGIGIANIIKTIDPHTIIMGGKITDLWDIIYPEIITVVNRNAYFGKKNKLQILPSSLQTTPCLKGAVTLAIKEIFEGFKITI